MYEVTKLARLADIVMLQETHATAADVVCEGAAHNRGFWWSASTCEPARAGLLTMVRKGLLGEGEEFVASESVPGRVDNVRLQRGEPIIDTTNFHNYGMAIAEVNRACAQARLRLGTAAADPLQRVYFFGGDLNIELGRGDFDAAASSGLQRGLARSARLRQRFGGCARP